MRPASIPPRPGAAVRAHAAFLEALLDQFPNGSINVFDQDLRYLLVAGQGLAQVGLLAEQLVGRRLHDVFPSDAVAEVLPYYARAFQGETVTFELTVAGEVYIITATPLGEVPDAGPAILAVAHNITARKQAEADRLVLLAREQAARQAAEAAIRLRDTFLSVASHELKTPLTALLGTVHLLERWATRDAVWTDQSYHALQRIAQQARRLTTMVDGLLDLSRLESGQFALTPEPLDLAALVQQVVTAWTAQVNTHALTYAGPTTPLMVLGDAGRLEQVLDNLLQNAIKYSPAGGVVTVRAAPCGARVAVAVSDQGIGIAEADQDQLFTPFYRAAPGATPPVGGLGIGLYVVKEIITRHGGDVTVTSTVGQGTTVTLWLPAAPAPGD
jgi:PAS domain S-box-containing protein